MKVQSICTKKRFVWCYFPFWMKNPAGFSTLEIMVAFVVIILSLTAVIDLVFSGEILSADSQFSGDAMLKAEDLLEVAKLSAVQNFYSISGFGPVQDGIYQKSLLVQNMDQYTKQITVKLNWQNGGRNNNMEFNTLIGDKIGALGGDTCSQQVSGNWQSPQVNNFDIAQISGLVGNYSISSLDAYQGKLYIGVNSTTNKTDPTFFVFDISNSTQPVFLSAIDNDTKVQAGITALKVAGRYAYVAIISSYSRGQLQIIDLSLNPPQVVKTYKVPVVNSSGSSKGLGASIFYRNGLLYLGLTKSDSEKEFNIIDVADPLHPSLNGAYFLGNGLNSLYIRGDYAYLAHPTDASANPQEQLTVLNVANPNAIVRTGGFYFNGSSGGNGKSLYLLSDKLYFGRTASKISGTTADFIPEFFVLDNSFQNDPTTTLGSIPLPTPQSLNGLIVRGSLAYFLTTNQFQVWELSNLPRINFWSYPVTLPASTTAFDCEGNTFYAGSVDALGKGYLSIISAGP